MFLAGQRCQAMATRLMEEIKRTDLAPFRSKAVVRMLEHVGREREAALRRATELTQQYLAVLLQPLLAVQLPHHSSLRF